jgi:hypothetical protein
MKEQVIELWFATPVETDNLAIEHRPASTGRSQFFAKVTE